MREVEDVRSPLPALEPTMEEVVRLSIQEGIDNGFREVDTILEWACDAADADEEISECTYDEIYIHAQRILVDVSVRRWIEERNWAETDNDRLDRAFAELEKQGIVARQNFTCCGSCGWAEIGDEIEKAERKGHTVTGCTFYHSQDTDHAMEGGNIYLAFGSTTDETEDTLTIGRRITEVLRSAGFTVEWDGMESHTIVITGICWQRRWQPRFYWEIAVEKYLQYEPGPETDEFIAKHSAQSEPLRTQLSRLQAEFLEAT